ncbi:MAG: hypothetical protein LQ341_003396 [Variospora aurantia]|nr:MAG: hypothetical protein LQ341_003396 [Variospora aurantia]
MVVLTRRSFRMIDVSLAKLDEDEAERSGRYYPSFVSTPVVAIAQPLGLVRNEFGVVVQGTLNAHAPETENGIEDLDCWSRGPPSGSAKAA